MPLHLILGFSLYLFLIGIVGSLLLKFWKNGVQVFFLLSSLGCILLLITSILFFNQTPYTLEIPLGIPGFPLHFNWDFLSAFFVMLLSVAATGISLFSSHYFCHFDSRAQRFICFHYHWFIASMIWVFLAADAYSFLLAWEFMALSSYFLIIAVQPTAENRHAGFLYFLIAHLGAIAILFSFALMLPTHSDFTFAMMRHSQLSPLIANGAFVLAFIGFGAKAGLLPLHVWLPKAHPAAPSPISALMSGVMLKTAIYGMLRVFFDLLANKNLDLGLIVLIAGSLTAILGVILAAMQTDMKRLLAYSSIENIGIITIGIGLALLFNASQYPVFAALALSAALFHCFNHALFKSLLFLGTGSVLHATGERNLGKLGGLIARMPWVAGLILIGTLAISGIPPLNGFVSEWLLLQAFLFFPKIPIPYVTMLIPVAAAIFVLTIGLTAYVMVKFYGIIFLGKPRENQLMQAHDASLLERCGLGWLAACCLLLGLFPFILLRPLTQLSASLLGQFNLPLYTQSSWLFLIPVSHARASYSPFLFFSSIIIVFAILYLAIRWFYHGNTRRSHAWDCGYPWQNARMQDTAEGFGQPIKRIFSAFMHVKMEIPNGFDTKPHYRVQTEDRFWYLLYFPLMHGISWIAKKIAKIQQGRISIYLLYSFLTLIVLLWWVL
jgi:formate hydrogenlyase subunit 3/multisubunit Na+/H+ antiporter MnhD subunit